MYSMSDENSITKVLAEIGRRGGHARAKALNAKRRQEIAQKASKAAAKARSQRAKAKKQPKPL
jgi:general stress protein YciG